MSILTAGSIFGFSPDSLPTALKETFAAIGEFIPKNGVAAGATGKAAATTAPHGRVADQDSKFVDGSRDRRAKALASAGARRGGTVARSRESYVEALKNRARPKSLPKGAVESVAQVIINAAKAGGESLNTVAEVYRACFLDACSGVTQTARGDFQDDKGVS